MNCRAALARRELGIFVSFCETNLEKGCYIDSFVFGGEKMSRSGALIEKSQRFGSRMVKLNRYLRECCREWMISNQIFRSGTSIGANIAEGVFAISEKDLRAKHRIALKEARETSYWLFLLKDGGYISEREYESLEGDLEELIRMLLASVRTLERRDQTP